VANKKNSILVIVALALVATIVFAVNHRRAGADGAGASTPSGPVPAKVMADFSSITPAVWQSAGTDGATAPVYVGKENADKGGGKASFLYIGALYCPYCAAARWSVIAALSRFGTFQGLTYSASSSQDVYASTPTFSFYHSTYTSNYVDFSAVELQGAEPVGGRYPDLEKPTMAQEALIEKYDAPPYLDKASAGGIPFMLIGGQYMWSGSPYNPGLLAGRTHETIAASLPAGTDATAQAILSNANEITAAICAVDGNKPDKVCTSPEIVAAVKKLPTKVP
jgi:thiol-disulfide isomerase/thioredoxin